jgi:2-C-methyl-D-erythritol 2,4-cyclodiphosphate synthase
MLGGVRIAHTRGLEAHSDGDVLIHALCDAIYGALAEGDIGRHFPPSEAAWRGADSRRFLEHAAGRIAARGLHLANADLTVVCELPKLAPHVDAIRTRLATILGCNPDQIGVKGTTTEKLGFTGRGEGIAAHAVVLLVARS